MDANQTPKRETQISIRDEIENLTPQFKRVLPHISVERFVRVVLTAIVMDSQLAQPDRRSLLELVGIGSISVDTGNRLLKRLSTVFFHISRWNGPYQGPLVALLKFLTVSISSAVTASR